MAFSLFLFTARLLRERDSYRTRLETLQQAAPAAAQQTEANGKRPAPDSQAAEEPVGKKARPALGSDVVAAMTARSTELSKGRKKRIIPDTIASPEDIAAYTLTGTHALHATRKGGILALAVSPDADNLVATAGADSTIALFDRTAGQTVATLKGHSKKVLDVSFVASRSVLVSGSADKTVRVWKAEGSPEDGQYTCGTVLQDGGGEVVAVAVHPTNDYVITAGSEGSWSFYDINRGECLAVVGQDGGDSNNAEGYSSGALHPDGLILCTGGVNSTVRVWETRTQKSVAKFDGHTGPVTSLSFSENGYIMASAASDGVKLWDLRKLQNFKNLEPYGAKTPATSVRFDRSGLFLAVGGADARVYGVKQDWGVVKEFSDVPKKGVNAVAWGADARALLVGAADHNLRVFS